MNSKYLSSSVILGSLSLLSSCGEEVVAKKPNVVFVFTDQWRYQATSFAGDVNVRTPNLDQLNNESVNFAHAYSCVSASTPYRGSLLTGQYNLNHGLFLNDVQLDFNVTSIADAFIAGGYNTAYVGKWHVNGNGRNAYIPEDQRLGFQYFKGLECSHEYNESAYYDNNDTTMRFWDGYDAIPQTADVINYMTEHKDDENPFLVMLSLGAPHNPYFTAPEEYANMYKDAEIVLRPNVPEEDRAKAIEDLRGYYAHIAAVDASIGTLLQAIENLGIKEETIFVFTSDHGDMLGSQGLQRKQKPYNESAHIPFILRYPGKLGTEGRTTNIMLNEMDIMPTLLGLSGVDIPESVDGRDVSGILLGTEEDKVEGALVASISPFGEFHRYRPGIAAGREYRGIYTTRYTYVKDLNGPWLLFDNEKDPYQLTNIVNNEDVASIQEELDAVLMKKLEDLNDEFLPGQVYLDKWGYKVDKTGTAPYHFI